MTRHPAITISQLWLVEQRIVDHFLGRQTASEYSVNSAAIVCHQLLVAELPELESAEIAEMVGVGLV
jgi:hypothetical protein